MFEFFERLEVSQLGDVVVRQYEGLKVGYGQVNGGRDGVYSVVG